MATKVSSVLEGFGNSLEPGKDGRVVLQDYGISVVTECENEACDNEFESPVIIMVDPETQPNTNMVCNDCAEAIA